MARTKDSVALDAAKVKTSSSNGKPLGEPLEENRASYNANTLRIGNAEEAADIEQMSCSLELVTPAKAERMLEGSATNRSISGGHSARQARAMIESEWRVSSQGIGVDYNGLVIDGQHRLKAVVDTGVSIWIWVMRGLYPDTIRAIDDNRKRSFSDDLKIAGKDRYASRAALTNLVLRFEQGAAKGLNLGVTRSLPLNRTETARHLREYERKQDVEHLLVVANRASRHAGVPMSAVSAAYYLALEYKASESEVSAVDEFFEKLSTGFNVTPAEPVGALLNSVRVRQEGGKNLDTTETCAAILYCLEKTLEGERMTRLQWTAVKRRKPENLLS